MIILRTGVHLQWVNVCMNNIPASVSVAGKLLFIMSFMQTVTKDGSACNIR